MIEYNTQAAAFIKVNDSATEQGMARAKDILGESAWKAGWSKENQKVARDCLLEAGAEVVEAMVGRLAAFQTVVNKSDDGTEYRKVWMSLAKARKLLFTGVKGQLTQHGPTLDRPEIVTMSVDAEHVQRLLAKLEAVQPGDIVKVAFFPTQSPARNDGRSFINHAATLKRLQGGQYVEVKALNEHVRQAGLAANAAVAVLTKAGIKAKGALWAARAGAKGDHFWTLAQEIKARFPHDGDTGEPGADDAPMEREGGASDGFDGFGGFDDTADNLAEHAHA